jgi:hypothetical protein
MNLYWKGFSSGHWPARAMNPIHRKMKKLPRLKPAARAGGISVA